MTEKPIARHVLGRTTCPDCQTPLQPIRLIDHSARPDRDLEYAAGDAEQTWSLAIPVAGKVRAHVCPSCRRIVLYAEPFESP